MSSVDLMSLWAFVSSVLLCSSVRERKERTWERKRPLPRPLPRREGAWSPRYPYKKDVGYLLSLIRANISSNALWTLYAGGLLWARTVRQKTPWTLCALWEINLSSVRERPHHAPCKQPNRGNLTYYAPPYGATLSTHLFNIITHWYSAKYLRMSWFFSIFVYAIKQHIWLSRRR